MLQALEEGTRRRALALLLALGAVVLAWLVLLGGSNLALLTGPEPFEQMGENDLAALEGRYVEGDLTTLVDYYAETIHTRRGQPEELTAREYLLPVGIQGEEVVYLGLQVGKDQLARAQAVLNDTLRMLADQEDSYAWDGSHLSVRGTICRMDGQTEELYASYLTQELGLEESLIGMEEGCYFLPLVLVDGQVGNLGSGILLLLDVLTLLVLGVLGWQLYRTLHAGEVSPSPEALPEQVAIPQEPEAETEAPEGEQGKEVPTEEPLPEPEEAAVQEPASGSEEPPSEEKKEAPTAGEEREKEPTPEEPAQ